MVLLGFFFFLAAAEVGLDAWVVRQDLSAADRFPIPPEKGDLYLFSDIFNQTPGRRILFAGDSVINGGAVDQGSSTLPAWYADELRTDGSTSVIPSVFNGGITNATPNDVLAFLHLLNLRPGDTVIYNLNLAHFSKPYPFEHRQTLARMGKTWDSRILDAWRLYRYRDVLRRSLFAFGGRQEDHIVYDTRPWQERDWSGVEAGAPLGWYHVQNDNLHLQALREIVADTEAQGFSLILFNSPRNRTLADQLGNVDFSRLEEEVDTMISLLQEGDWLYLDYMDAVPSPYFGDTVHPTAAGYKVLAHRLYQDLQAERGSKDSGSEEWGSEERGPEGLQLTGK